MSKGRTHLSWAKTVKNGEFWPVHPGGLSPVGVPVHPREHPSGV